MSSIDDEVRLMAPGIRIYNPPYARSKIVSSKASALQSALRVTTHMIIAAHADDDGLIGAQAISETYLARNNYMTAIVVSASPGTGRPPGFQFHSDEQMIKIRFDEQTKAADAGKYAGTVQLGFSSDDVKGMENDNPDKAEQIIKTLETILLATPHLKKLYLHSIFDEHETHQALVMLSLAAVRRMPAEKRPAECYGVEVSSSLSWLPAKHRVLLPVTRIGRVRFVLEHYKTELAKRRYDKGLEGRAVSNEVFQRDKKPISTDTPHVCALDYSTIIASGLDLADAMANFKHEILDDFTAAKMREEKTDAYRHMPERHVLAAVLQK